jgi:hypothetical protein
MTKRAGHRKACKAAQKARAAAEADPQNDDALTVGETGLSPAGACGYCGREAPGLLVCAGCHEARYCSAEHQRQAWFVRDVLKIFRFVVPFY